MHSDAPSCVVQFEHAGKKRLAATKLVLVVLTKVLVVVAVLTNVKLTLVLEATEAVVDAAELLSVILPAAAWVPMNKVLVVAVCETTEKLLAVLVLVLAVLVLAVSKVGAAKARVPAHKAQTTANQAALRRCCTAIIATEKKGTR